MIIAIDFDGTCVTHEFPLIGKDIGAAPVLRDLVANGHKLILWTMRSDIETPASEDADIHLKGGPYLTDAVTWFVANEIPLWGIQSNPEQKSWSLSPKAYAHIYIDDAALGCPLVFPLREKPNDRAYVDWAKVQSLLTEMGYLQE